ncbi:lysophospholipid acyltransferase family protein [Paratractidigestivibacter sp.]|uniref:lysophospholipid acyltransferase family protein n=1 Tax=Paratractidigestivibacter sp. TaxID=2847316 RepID=UPI002AC99967|nr:lysophospholipid acyltransferase family protein [Paratractidigestivibacter sp.]
MATEETESTAAKKDEAAPKGKLHAFAGNSYDDYYDSAMSDFPWTARVLMNIVVYACYAFTKIVWPWKIENAELLVNDKRGRVIISNHESMVDPVLLVVTCWRAGIHLRIVYKSEFDKVAIARWLFSRVGGFPVNRGATDMKAVRRARAALQRGECLLIYPEGTRVKNDADAQVHGGYALMAQLAKAPVQPIAMVGARFLKFRSRIVVRAGEPIEWSELQSKKRKEQVAEMERRGMDEVFAIREELRRAYPELKE